LKAKTFKACFQKIFLTVHTVTNITKRELHLIKKLLNSVIYKDTRAEDSGNLYSRIKREASGQQDKIMTKPVLNSTIGTFNPPPANQAKTLPGVPRRHVTKSPHFVSEQKSQS
jgi:hypothetical protein